MPNKTVWYTKTPFGLIRASSEKTPGSKRAKLIIPNKRSRGRDKGNELERETAKTLSQWLYGDDCTLRRTPLSGGWGTGKQGDVAIDPEILRTKKTIKYYPIYVECRNYRDLLQHNFFRWVQKGSPNTLTKWCKEVESKCDGRLPMLVLKGTGTDPWIFIMEKWASNTMYAAMSTLEECVMFLRSGKLGFLFPLEKVDMLGSPENFFKGWEPEHTH